MSRTFKQRLQVVIEILRALGFPGHQIEKDIGDDDFYGQSYFVDPRGQFLGELGSAHDEELIVRDMDLDKITEVRQTWQFYRDRRPDAYEDLVRP